MGFTVTNKSGLLALERLMNLPDRLPQMASRVDAEALGMAIVAAQANIYSTAKGAYTRTGEYLRSLDTKAQVTRTGIRVTISSSAEYAAAIEYGRDQISPAMIEAVALAGRPNEPVQLGRSGLTWWVAGPVLTSAQVHSVRLMRELVLEEVRRR